MNTLTCSGENGSGSQLIQLNNNRKRTQSERVYDVDGLSVTLNAAGNDGFYKVDGEPKINKIGNVRNGHHAGDVYDINGLAPTERAVQYKDPIKIMEPQIRKVGNVNNGQGGATYNPDGISPCLCSGDLSHNGGINIIEPKINRIGNLNGHQSGEVIDNNGISRSLCNTDWKAPVKIVQPVLTPDRENKRQNGRRMKGNGEEMFTLTAQDRHGVYDGYSIRKLTPIECERLQGFPDDWTKYGKDGELISDTQRYKCCGNAVTTNVIAAIVNEMFD